MEKKQNTLERIKAVRTKLNKRDLKNTRAKKAQQRNEVDPELRQSIVSTLGSLVEQIENSDDDDLLQYVIPMQDMMAQIEQGSSTSEDTEEATNQAVYEMNAAIQNLNLEIETRNDLSDPEGYKMRQEQKIRDGLEPRIKQLRYKLNNKRVSHMQRIAKSKAANREAELKNLSSKELLVKISRVLNIEP